MEEIGIRWDRESGLSFTLNGEEARIQHVDEEHKRVIISTNGDIAACPFKDIVLATGQAPNFIEKELWKAAYIQHHKDDMEELDLLHKTENIIISDQEFTCTWPEHVDLAKDTKKLVMVKHIGKPGQFIVLPICNECYAYLAWNSVKKEYETGKE